MATKKTKDPHKGRSFALRAEEPTPSLPASIPPPTLPAIPPPPSPPDRTAAHEESRSRITFRFKIPGIGFVAGELARIFRRVL